MDGKRSADTAERTEGETMDAIFKRTSVRKFQEAPVEQEKLDLLLKAAMAAPSAGNQQPWEFYVTTSKPLLRTLSGCSPYSGCTAEAPLAIVPCFRTDGLRFSGCAQMDMSAAVENILLEAVEQGLGAVWMAITPDQDRIDAVAEALDLPQGLQAFAIVAVGYPVAQTQQQNRFDEARVHVVG